MNRLFLIIFLVCQSIWASAQHHLFISYSVKEGLAQSQVRDIIQSEDGYLWIATIGGVSRFDGQNFVTFNKSNGLLNNIITSIHERSDHSIIVACQGGIVIIKGSQVQQFPFPEKFKETFVLDMEEYQHEMYFASNGDGLIKWNQGEMTAIDLGSSSKNFVRSLESFDDKLIIGTKEGLLAYSDKKIETILGDISVNTTAQFNQEIWITTTKDGVYKISKNDTIQYTTEDGLTSMFQKDVCIDKSGTPWFISKNGIQKLNIHTNEFQSIQSIDENHDHNLKVLYADREKNIWIGTSGAGILKYTGDQSVAFTSEDGLSSDQIMNITQDSKGNYWFATYGAGVMQFDGNSFKTFNYTNGLLNNTVWSVLANGDEIWVGTSEGINIIENGRIHPFKNNSSLPFIRVSSLFKDSYGNIWIGTRDGLVRSHNEEINTPAIFSTFKINEVKSFQQIDETIWFSSNTGIFAYNSLDNSLTQIGKETGLANQYFSCIAKDHQGNLWFGTDDGVFRYNPKNKNIQKIEISPNASSNVVNSMVVDYAGQLWAGTDNGLFSLSMIDDTNANHAVIRSYNEHDGIVGQECNQNAAFSDIKGQIWIGTNGGLIRIDPEEINSHQTNSFLIHLTDVQLNFESIHYQETIDSLPTFSFDENRFTFKYSAIYFANPERISYSYRMLGAGNDWSPMVSENYVTFSNLSPGEYEFQVRAKVENEPWSKKFASYKFVINPPYYLTWWFLTLGGLCFAALSFGLYYQIENQRKRKQNLVEFQNKTKILSLEQQTLNAHMNRHFIFNALNSIQYYINTQERKLANLYLTNFASLIRKNLDSAQQESIYLKDELERLELYLKLEQMRFKDRFTYQITVDKSLDASSLNVPSMILQPFVENSIMHGILPTEHTGFIEIMIFEIENSICFIIKDNGIGVETSLNQKPKTLRHVSNGMKITRQRLEVMQNMTKLRYQIVGPIELKDENENPIGTIVEIYLPMIYKGVDEII